MTTDATAVTPPPAGDYPVRLSIDYADGPRNRLTTLVRPILVIPIVVILMLLSGGFGGSGGGKGEYRDGPWGGPGDQIDRGGRWMPGAGWWMRGYGWMSGYAGMPGPSMMPGYTGAPGPGPGMMPGFTGVTAPGASPAAPGATADRDGRGRWDGGSTGAATGLGIVFLPTVLMLLFRRKYPRWWFDWSRELSRFGTRVGAYLFLLRDEYPSTDEEQAVHLEIDYPDAQQLNRWLPLVKWLLAIPHYIVLIFLGIGVVLAWIASWVMILVTGSQPRGLFDYTVGVGRWCSRVSGYAFMLVTDRYPPFSLK